MLGVDEAVIEHSAVQVLARGLGRVKGRVPAKEHDPRRHGKFCHVPHSQKRVLVPCFLSLLRRTAGDASATRYQSRPFARRVPPPLLAVPALPAQADEERGAAPLRWRHR
jgi:hypothetical protein